VRRPLSGEVLLAWPAGMGGKRKLLVKRVAWRRSTCRSATTIS